MAAVLTRARPLEEGETEALLDFARGYYGPGSHQANPRRFEWLYRHNPLSRGPGGDVLVAVAESGQVVGCHWKTRLRWRWDGQEMVIPSMHDLAILPEYRQGQGLALVLGALAGEKKAALLGLSPASNAIYERLRCPRVPMSRLRKVLSYPRTLAGMAGVWRGGALPESQTWERASGGFTARVWTRPDTAALERALAPPYRGPRHLVWDADTFRWRFFHPLGPRHALVTLEERGNVRARAVFSHGWRRGAPLARWVDAAVEDIALYPRVVEAVEWAMRKSGVAVATAATAATAVIDALRERGWTVQTGVESRFHAPGGGSPGLEDIWGGCYDYGYDAS